MTHILVRRTGALGDVLETTPIIRRLRAENPDAFIEVETDYPQIFTGNSSVNRANSSSEQSERGSVSPDREINLNMAFESRMRKLHPIDAYSEVAFGDHETPHDLIYSWEFMETNAPKLVVLHAARSWPIRTLPRTFWQSLIDLLRAADYAVILTGTAQDWDGLENCEDFRGRLTLAQQVGVIDAADCFVCSESGPMIMAQVTRAPIIALTTMIAAEHIIHNRYGERGWRFYPVPANVPCVGCALEQPAAVTYFDCKFGHRQCVDSFDPKVIAELVEKVAVARAK